MKNKPVVPEFFQEAYSKYLTLQSKKEETAFWEEVKKSNTASPEELDRHLKEGLLLLSDQVDALSQKVKAKMPV